MHPILILLLGLAIAAVGSAAYFYLKPKLPSQNQLTPTQPPQTTSTPTDETVYTEESRSATWKTYTYKNISFKYPQDWIVIFDSTVSGQPNGFSLHVNKKDEIGYQPDGLYISTHNDRSGTNDDYVLSTDKVFNLRKNGDSYIKFIRNTNITIYAGCAYRSRGQPTLDICNQILSTFKFLD